MVPKLIFVLFLLAAGSVADTACKFAEWARWFPPDRCLFAVTLIHTCDSNDLGKPAAFADIQCIHTPSGANLSGTYIRVSGPDYATILVKDPASGIDNVLSIEQTGEFTFRFGWEYGVSRDGKALYYWTETAPGFQNHYGCTERYPNGGIPDCRKGIGGEHKRLYECWFKCIPPTVL